MKHPCSFSEWSDCFCNNPPTLNTIRRGFTQLLRYCFSNPEHYADNKEYLGCLSYSDDPRESKLSVLATGASDPSNTQNIPGVFISLGDQVQFQRHSINDTVSISRDYARETNSMLATANIQIKCSHKNADISCALADMCMLFLMAAKKHVRKAWGWVRLMDIVSQTEPKLTQQSESDSSNRWYDSTLVIQLIYEYAIDIDTESKRLKEYSLDKSVSL